MLTPAALLTPVEFGQILDLAANAPARVGDGFKLSEMLNRAIALANQPHPIGALAPVEAHPAPSVPEISLAEYDALLKICEVEPSELERRKVP